MLNIENFRNYRIIFSYSLVVLLSTWIFAFLIFSKPNVGLGLFGVVMFFPAIVALIFNRFIHKKSFKSMFSCVFIKPNLKSMVFSIGYPLIFIATCGIIALIIGLGYFNPGNSTLTYIIISSIIVILVNLISVFGEEYGWRGYLLPKLTIITGKTRATIILGVIWALYHFPLVYLLAKTTGIGNPLLIATIQAVGVFFITFAFSYSYYLSKGSLIPVLFLHSTWNTINVLILGDIYTNKSGIIAGNIPIINGEGVFGLILGGILVLWFINQFNKSEKYTNNI
jgi:membrane protease YdiL (CAAX protease family)